MISLLLIIHVALMVASVASTVGFTAAATFKQDVSRQLLNASYLVTAVGILAGGLLLLSRPLDMKCMILVGYVFAFIAVHRFYILKNIRLTA